VSPDPIARLVALLSRLPGLGEKSAGRLVYFLLRGNPDSARELGRAIAELPDQVVRCRQCQDLGASDPCRICHDPERDRSLLMVVEEPHDVRALERAQSFRGLYHVLHGNLSPLLGRGPEQLTVDALLHRLQAGEVKEVILALNPHVEGDATAAYLAERLQGLPLKVSRLARGIPVGGDLEYLDPGSLSQAIRGRRRMEGE